MKLLEKYKYLLLIFYILVFIMCSSSPDPSLIYKKAQSEEDAHRRIINLEKIVLIESNESKTVYYKILALIELGREDEALSLIDGFKPLSDEELYLWLYLKGLKLRKLNLFSVSQKFIELVFKTKNRELKRKAFYLYCRNLISLFRKKMVSIKEYEKFAKKLILISQKEPHWLYHYSLFLLYFEERKYKDAIEEAIVCIEFGMPSSFLKDIKFYLRYIKNKEPEVYSLYAGYFEKKK